MIVDSMTLEEVAQELLGDMDDVRRIADYRFQKYKSLVLKSHHFPVIRHYECKTVERKNRFFVTFTAMKRSDWKEPYCHYYCIYIRPEGMYCALVGPEDRTVNIYPPHFFSRYRERIIKRNDISPEDLIHLFMSRHWSNFSHYVDLDQIKGLSKWEQLIHDGEFDLFGTCPDGIIFGQRTKRIVLNKTIISESMLFPNQVEFYESVYNDYHDYLRENYPADVVSYIIGLEYDFYTPPEPATKEAIERLRKKYEIERTSR